jgi:amino acid adenylation domain-containing protein
MKREKAMHNDSTLQGYLAASARRWPNRMAVVDPDGSALTYRELDDRSERVAAFLRSQGIQPGDRVGLVVPKGMAAVTAIFGILKARAAFVPVDYTAPPERNRTILRDCQVRLVFLDPRCAATLGKGPDALHHTAVVEIDGSGASALEAAVTWQEVLAHPCDGVHAEPSATDLAYILYTSGSTGVPKGVMLTQDNAVSFVDWCSSEFNPTEEDRFSSHAPFHFDLSVLDIYVPLKHGATLCIVSEDLGKNPKELAAFISEKRLTVWYSTPSILSFLAQFGDLHKLDCTSLRLVLFAGEVFPVKHLRAITERWPQAEYFNLYGPTETNVCTFARIPLPVPADRTIPYPIGWPCSHCSSLLLDEPDGQPVEPGEDGLLYIAGPSVFDGYWNRPQESQHSFIQRNGRRWYNTGDVVRQDGEDGFVYLGRRDRMVKRRGYRIELGEIERGLYQHPDVREAATVAVPDADSGVRILAYLVPHARKPSIIDLKAFCTQALPGYMSPDMFRFLDALPRTSTNKVDYQALLKRTQESVAR